MTRNFNRGENLMDESVFDGYAAYYDALYRDKDYRGEVGYLVKILSRTGVERGNILELGTGTGKHAELLSEQGFTVEGIELSAEMIQQCQVSDTFRVTQGDIRNTQVGVHFDAAISMFHVISYMQTNEDVLKVFANVHQQIKSGGIFIFDVWYTPAVLSQKPETRVRRFSEGGYEFIRIAEPVQHDIENTVDVNYFVSGKNVNTDTTFEITEKHVMRHFSVKEIELFASISGFEVTGKFEFMTDEEPSSNSWGVLFVLKKS